MDADLQKVYDEVLQAAYPEDIFGSEDVVLPAASLLEFLRLKYEPLKRITKESYHNPADASAAAEADQQLETLYAVAKSRIELQIYGMEGRGRLPPPSWQAFDLGVNRYFRGERVHQGEHSSIYQALLQHRGDPSGEVIIKIVNDPDFNDFAENEARILELLHQRQAPQWKHLPYLLDKFQAGGRVGLVVRKISGFSLREVRTHRNYLRGVDQRDMVWMMARALSCLGYVHALGIAHGNLTPEHLIVQPGNHNVVVTGWSSAIYKPAEAGERVHKFSDDWCAPEVRTHGRIGPWSDLYSLGKILIWLLGGDPERREFPPKVEPAIRGFIDKLVQEDPLARPADAWALWQEQEQIKDRLWRRKFRHFDMT